MSTVSLVANNLTSQKTQPLISDSSLRKIDDIISISCGIFSFYHNPQATLNGYLTGLFLTLCCSDPASERILDNLKEPKLTRSQKQRMLSNNIFLIMTTSLVPTLKNNSVSCFLRGMIFERSGMHLFD